jgi:hypothetical protein
MHAAALLAVSLLFTAQADEENFGDAPPLPGVSEPAAEGTEPTEPEALPPPPYEEDKLSEEESEGTAEGGAGEADDEGEDGEKEGGSVGFMEKYFPLTFADDLSEPVDDQKLWFIISGLFMNLAAPVWLPPVVVEADVPDGYYMDAAMIWGVHVAPHLLPLACLPVSFCAFLILPPVGFIMWAGAILINGANALACAANGLYCTPVAIANQYDRMLKAQGLVPPPPPPAAPPPPPPAQLGKALGPPEMAMSY